MADRKCNRTFIESLIRKSRLDPPRVNGFLRNASATNEKLSKIAISAASRSAEISNAWTMDTLARLEKASATKEDPSDYASAAVDLAMGTVGDSTKLVANFMDVARSLQNETLEFIHDVVDGGKFGKRG